MFWEKEVCFYFNFVNKHLTRCVLKSFFWDEIIDYQNIEILVLSLEVVNDCAERGVKLMNDLKDISKDAKEQQYLYQVKEDYRNRFHTFTNKLLIK